MSIPYITVVYDPPLASDTDAEFDQKGFDTIAKLNPWGQGANSLANWMNAKGDQIQAAVAAGELGSLTGKGGEFIRVATDETAVEFVDPATVVLAEAPELTQLQVEDDTSTVFGQVSGQRLAQSVVENVGAATAGLAVGAIGTYAFLKFNSTSPPTVSPGGTVAGSNMQFQGAVTANFSGSSGPTMTASGVTVSGTWQCMGHLEVAGGIQTNNVTLYLRIS